MVLKSTKSAKATASKSIKAQVLQVRLVTTQENSQNEFKWQKATVLSESFIAPGDFDKSAASPARQTVHVDHGISIKTFDKGLAATQHAVAVPAQTVAASTSQPTPDTTVAYAPTHGKNHERNQRKKAAAKAKKAAARRADEEAAALARFSFTSNNHLDAFVAADAARQASSSRSNTPPSLELSSSQSTSPDSYASKKSIKLVPVPVMNVAVGGRRSPPDARRTKLTKPAKDRTHNVKAFALKLLEKVDPWKLKVTELVMDSNISDEDLVKDGVDMEASKVPPMPVKSKRASKKVCAKASCDTKNDRGMYSMVPLEHATTVVAMPLRVTMDVEMKDLEDSLTNVQVSREETAEKKDEGVPTEDARPEESPKADADTAPSPKNNTAEPCDGELVVDKEHVFNDEEAPAKQEASSMNVVEEQSEDADHNSNLDESSTPSEEPVQDVASNISTSKTYDEDDIRKRGSNHFPDLSCGPGNDPTTTNVDEAANAEETKVVDESETVHGTEMIKQAELVDSVANVVSNAGVNSVEIVKETETEAVDATEAVGESDIADSTQDVDAAQGVDTIPVADVTKIVDAVKAADAIQNAGTTERLEDSADDDISDTIGGLPLTTQDMVDDQPEDKALNEGSQPADGQCLFAGVKSHTEITDNAALVFMAPATPLLLIRLLNRMEYTPALSWEGEQYLIDLHVRPLVFLGSSTPQIKGMQAIKVAPTEFQDVTEAQSQYDVEIVSEDARSVDEAGLHAAQDGDKDEGVVTTLVAELTATESVADDNTSEPIQTAATVINGTIEDLVIVETAIPSEADTCQSAGKEDSAGEENEHNEEGHDEKEVSEPEELEDEQGERDLVLEGSVLEQPTNPQEPTNTAHEQASAPPHPGDLSIPDAGEANDDSGFDKDIMTTTDGAAYDGDVEDENTSNTGSGRHASRLHTLRTTVLGNISLYKLLAYLPWDAQTGSTTRDAMTTTFTALAAADAANPTVVGLVSSANQQRVMLGDTSLVSFLQEIGFDRYGVVNVVDVKNAFERCVEKEGVALKKVMRFLDIEDGSE